MHLFLNDFMHLWSSKVLGSDHNDTGTSKTYTPVHITNNKVISGHTILLRNKLNLKFIKKSRHLSNICWTSKLRKHPSKARFLIAAPQCFVKPLSKDVTSVLKIYRNFKLLKFILQKCITYQGLNHFDWYKKTRLILMQSKNVTLEIEVV